MVYLLDSKKIRGRDIWFSLIYKTTSSTDQLLKHHLVFGSLQIIENRDLMARRWYTTVREQDVWMLWTKVKEVQEMFNITIFYG